MNEHLNEMDSANERVLLSQSIANAYPKVFAFLRASVRDFHTCEDLLQEVVATAAEKFDRYDRNSPFLPWILGIARNRVLMHLRTSTRDRHVFDETTVASIASGFLDIDGEFLPRREALERCNEKLSGRARKMLELRYARDQLPIEIAKAVGMTANAVSIFLHRVRSSLRDCIERDLESRSQPGART